MSLTPFIISLMSNPNIAKGKSPTAEKTLYLPPTFSGIPSLSMFISSAKFHKGLSYCVVMTTLSWMDLPCSSNRFMKVSALAIVSVVVPDFVTMFSSMSSPLCMCFSVTFSMSFILAASVVSAKYTFGMSGMWLCISPRTASIIALVPRLDPPMPHIISVSTPLPLVWASCIIRSWYSWSSASFIEAYWSS